MLKKCGGQLPMPPSDQTTVLWDRGESAGDLPDPGAQRKPNTSRRVITERKKHCADDTNGDDYVLERHHAVLVRAQTLQCFSGLNVILQHRRKSLPLRMNNSHSN